MRPNIKGFKTDDETFKNIAKLKRKIQFIKICVKIFILPIIMIITINYGGNVFLHKILDLVKSVYYGLSRDDYG